MNHSSTPSAAGVTKPCHALLSGGGSGGHVFPGLAIASELANRGWTVSWAGSSQGVEARLVREQRLDFHPLPARPVAGQGWVGKGRAALLLSRSALSARSLVRRLGARVVVGTGGYVSVPAVLGGRLASRPVLLVEPNADAGMANRGLSRFASEAAIAHDSTATQLRCRSTLTGIPISDEFFEIGDLPPRSPLRLLVVGGSQGARQLNELLPAALSTLGDLGPLEICHQAGPRLHDEARAAYEAMDLGTIQVEVVPFLDDMVTAIERSHLVVSRAGAITLAELCAAGRPSILVPLALAGAHQVGNAKRLEEAGAAVLLPPEKADSDALAQRLRSLLSQPQRLEAMAVAARSQGHRHAAHAIADRIEDLAEGGS